MITTLAGTSFNRVDFPIKKGDKVTVRREKENVDDNDSHPAYAVMLEGARIGYIPKVEKSKAKMLKARQNNDLRGYERLFQVCNLIEYLRDCIYTDIERNHITPHGEVWSVAYLEDGVWRDDAESGEEVSIRVIFDYQ